MTDYYFQCAAKLNNVGIFALAAGKRRRAFELFKNAFNILTHDERVIDPAVDEELDIPESVYSTALPFIPVSSPHLDFSGVNLSGGQQHQAFTYSKAFLFNPRLELERDCVCSFRSVLLFNMALVYHSSAVNPHDEYEVTSMALYDKCLELVERDDLEDLACVFIAALNNKIQIHHRRSELETTMILLEDLGSVLRESMKRGVECFDDEDINGLLLNISCQQATITAPSA